MTFKSFFTTIIAAVLAVSVVSAAQAASKKKIDRRVQEALVEFHTLVSGSEGLIKRAKGVLIFPKVTKAGIGIGGEKGDGALLIKGRTVGYYRTISASIGFQLGVQVRRQMIIFLDQDALDAFRNSDNWEVGVDGSVALVTLDAGGRIDTETKGAPVIGFIFGAKGLMYNLTLEGTKVSPIHRK
ncbi:MAG: hypothetical protein IID51_06500 [Proteobacteria bacterium]|nr:hypothetical protein [Pseudomonadota bacterium]